MLYFSRANFPGNLRVDKVPKGNFPSSAFDADLGQEM